MKIPENAQRVFEGIIYDVYQWEQDLYDGSKQTFEILKRPDTAQVIPVEEGKVYLGKEHQPQNGSFYSPFGGRVEKGEKPLEGVKREFLEETGYKADNWKLFASYKPSAKIDWNVYIYVASGLSPVQHPQQDAGEHIEMIPCTFDEFIEIVLSDEFRGREFAFDIARRLLRPGGNEALREELFSTDV